MDASTTAITVIAFTLLPAALGAAAGRRWGVVSLIAAPPMGLLLMSAGLMVWPHRVSVHEAAWITLAFALAAWFCAPTGSRATAYRVLSLVSFALTAEVGARVAGFSPLEDGPPSALTGPDHWPFACRLDAVTASAQASLRRPMPHVIHLGDSMTEGPRVANERTFVGLLDAADPGRSHLNLALSGTGPDCALVLLREVPSAHAAFLHIFPANDTGDLFVRQPWCGEDTLLDYDQPGLPTRCPDGPEDLPLHRRAAWDPSPYLHRQLARVFAVAGALEQHLWQRLPFWLGARPGYPVHEDAMPRARQVLAELHATAAAKSIPLHATLLPWSGLRPDAAYREELAQVTRDWREALLDLGIPTLDLTDALEDHTDPPQPGVYLSDAPPDPHFDVVGFRLLDATLRPWALDALEREAPPAPPTQPR